jgi:hypothetical protein
MKEATRFTSFSTIRFFMSLQGATMGSFVRFMCNGAFAYTKSLFEDLSGFDGNNTIASGDDVFFYKKLLPNILKKSII